MYLATPISKLFDSEIIGNRIAKESDCLECRDESAASGYPRQYLLHHHANIIHEWDNPQRQYLFSVINSKPELRLVTFHLGSSYKEAKVIGGIYQPCGRPYSRQELIDNARNNVLWLRTFLKLGVLIGVENNNYYPTPAYQHVTDGDFINFIVKDNKITFLFDFAHAGITAHNRHIDYGDYCSTLPLEEMVQLHISKFSVDKNDLACDTHELLDEQDLQEVERILKPRSLTYLTIEYYKDAEGLLTILKKCQKLKGRGNG